MRVGLVLCGGVVGARVCCVCCGCVGSAGAAAAPQAAVLGVAVVEPSALAPALGPHSAFAPSDDSAFAREAAATLALERALRSAAAQATNN